MNAFVKGYRGLISGLLFLIALVLLLLTGSSTTFLINDWTEQVFLTHDSAWRNVLYLVLTLGALYGLSRWETCRNALKKIRDNENTYRKCQAVLFLIAGVMAELWVYGNQVIPEQDQLFVLQAADHLNVGNYEDFQPGGYLSMYPNQTGLLVLELILTKLFGGMNYVIFYELNAVAYLAILWLLSELAGQAGADNLQKLATLLLSICFLPLLFYTTFLYGNLLGLAMALGAFYFELRYIAHHKVPDLVLAVFLIVFAAAIKNNYLIFMIAIVLHALVEAVRQKELRNTLMAALMIVVYIANSWAVTTALEHKTGGDLDNGVSTYAFIAMGLQVNPVKCDGWYNEFNKESYIESGYNADKQAELAKASISDSAEYLSTPSNAVNFFLRKNASQWADPLFQGLWVSQVRQTQNERPGWLNRVLSPRGSTAIGQALDVVQFMVYAGVLLYLIFARKNKKFFESLLLQVTVIGGFVFHCFWEAKGQYTFSYYVLLLPLAVLGVSAFLQWLAERVKNRNFAKMDIVKATVLGVVLLLTVLLPLGGPFDCLSAGSARFAAYLG